MLRDARGAVRSLSNRFGVLRDGVIQPRTVQQQFDVPANHHQQIVEVVRHAARELPDGFHLLRAAKLFFEVPALRDVRRHSGDAGDFAAPVAARQPYDFIRKIVLRHGVHDGELFTRQRAAEAREDFRIAAVQLED